MSVDEYTKHMNAWNQLAELRLAVRDLRSVTEAKWKVSQTTGLPPDFNPVARGVSQGLEVAFEFFLDQIDELMKAHSIED